MIAEEILETVRKEVAAFEHVGGTEEDTRYILEFLQMRLKVLRYYYVRCPEDDIRDILVNTFKIHEETPLPDGIQLSW